MQRLMVAAKWSTMLRQVVLARSLSMRSIIVWRELEHCCPATPYLHLLELCDSQTQPTHLLHNHYLEIFSLLVGKLFIQSLARYIPELLYHKILCQDTQ
jgi:hypothetical protein